MLYCEYYFFTVSEDRFRMPPFFRLLRCEGKEGSGARLCSQALGERESWAVLELPLPVHHSSLPSPGDSFPQWQLYDVSCSLEISIECVKNKFCFAFPPLFRCALLSRMMSSDTMPLHSGYSTLICLSVQCIHPCQLPCQPPSGLFSYQFDCCMLIVFKPLLFYLTVPKCQSMDADVDIIMRL